MLEEFHNPMLQAAAKNAIAARPALPDDDTSDVLVAGETFFYLGSDAAGEVFKFSTVPEGAPTRIVIDADSFLSGLVPDAMMLLAIREPDGLVLKINPPGVDLGSL